MMFEEWRTGTDLEEAVKDILSARAHKEAERLTEFACADQEIVLFKEDSTEYTKLALDVYKAYRNESIKALYNIVNEIFEMSEETIEDA